MLYVVCDEGVCVESHVRACGAVMCCTVLYGTVLYCAVLCCAVRICEFHTHTTHVVCFVLLRCNNDILLF